jgi:hypothetical protein
MWCRVVYHASFFEVPVRVLPESFYHRLGDAPPLLKLYLVNYLRSVKSFLCVGYFNSQVVQELDSMKCDCTPCLGHVATKP